MFSHEPDIRPDKNPDIARTNRTNRTLHHLQNPDMLGVYISTIYIPLSGGWSGAGGNNSYQLRTPDEILSHF